MLIVLCKKFTSLCRFDDTKRKLCRVLLYVFCGLVVGLLFFKATISPVVFRNWGLFRGFDGAHYYFWLRSIVFDWDFNFQNEITNYNFLPDAVRHSLLSQSLTPSGLLPNKYPIGWAFVTLPAVVIGQIGVLVLRVCGYNFALDGYSLPYQVAIVGLHLFYFFIGLSCFVRLLVSQKTSGSTTNTNVLGLIVWMGSPLLFYQTADIAMAHGLVFSFLCILYFFTIRLQTAQQKTYKLAVLLGFLSGLLVIIRPQASVYLLYPVASLFVDAKACLSREQRHSIDRVKVSINRLFNRKSVLLVLCFTSAFVGFPIMQFICHSIVNGGTGVYSYKGETFNFFAPHLWQVLFSPFHGSFYWNPILLLGVIGFIIRLIKFPSLFLRCLAFSGCLNIYINSAWHCWWFGASFGQRSMEGFVIISALGVVFLYESCQASLRAVLLSVLCLAMMWNVNLVALAIKRVLPLDRPLTYSAMMEMSKNYYVPILRTIVLSESRTLSPTL